MIVLKAGKGVCRGESSPFFTQTLACWCTEHISKPCCSSVIGKETGLSRASGANGTV